MFFPRLRKLVYSPDQPWRFELGKLQLADWKQKAFRYLAEMHFRTRLEIADANFLTQFENGLIRGQLSARPVEWRKQFRMP